MRMTDTARRAAPGTRPGRIAPRGCTRVAASRSGCCWPRPLGWLAIAYFGALFILLLSAFWEKDAFTGKVEPFTWSLDAFEQLFSTEVYRIIAIRTIGMAILVTVTDALLAFPIAYYMARVASPRKRGMLVVGRPDAALGGLPGQGLRLADRPPGQRPARLAPVAVRSRGPGH